MPTVSIAMPVYNGERYVAQAIESMLGQTFRDFEFVISDNASNDGTEALCRRYAATDSRIRYIRRTTNIGGPRNFDYAFSLCCGRYVKWTTADDFSDPHFLEQAVAVLERDPEIVLCYPRTQIVDADGRPVREYEDNLELDDASPRARFRQFYLRVGLCNAQLGLMRREAMLRTGLMATHRDSDVDFLGEMALLGKFRLLPSVRFYRRFHPAASSWALHDWKHQANYYSPGAKQAPRFDLWRRFAYQFRMVWRSPIRVTDKVALTRDVGRWMRHKRDALWRELCAGLWPAAPRADDHGSKGSV